MVGKTGIDELLVLHAIDHLLVQKKMSLIIYQSSIQYFFFFFFLKYLVGSDK